MPAGEHSVSEQGSAAGRENPYRSHDAGALRASDVGSTVRVAGWVHRRRDLGGLVFIDVRDATGLVQVRVDNDSPLADQASGLRSETVISVTGEVLERESKNPKMPTGDVEIVASALEMLSSNPEPLPLQVASEEPVSEAQRLTYRFLDLRKDRLQANIMLRNNVIRSLRQRMWAHGFHEFQTPILTASSPEGARDYLVPSRLHPGKFYALPQAPQQFKQLLMASGFPRYFQIAPCFRDEAARADRSPAEFYQLDMEMAFVDQDDVFEVTEDVIHGVFTEFSDLEVTPAPFERIPYAEAMLRFGSDKPDLRIPFEIHDVTEALRNTEFKVFAGIIASGGVVRAIPVPGIGTRSRKFFDGLDGWVKDNGGKGLAWLGFDGDKVKGSVSKPLSSDEHEMLRGLGKAADDGAVLLLAGDEGSTAKLAGRLRAEVAQQAELIDKGRFHLCWIVDYPMFEADDETGQIEFSHNPFSMPQGGLDTLENEDPLTILAYQYDLVCNGVELCSGAIRNHRPDIMYKAFAIAGYGPEVVDSKFPSMINAFKHGAPPHGGLAPGVDRIVMLLANEERINEVIAFPMTTAAQDLLMGAPSEVTPQQLDELSLRIVKPEKKD
ncbi:MAG: aspartate--tRNA ligase [Myxococcota bacterium]